MKRKGSNLINHLYQFVALALVCVTAIVATPGKTLPGSSPGIVTLNGTVMINQMRALSGQTVWSKSAIATSKNSECLIEFSNSVRLNVSEETNLTVAAAPTRIDASLTSGQIHGFWPAGVTLNFNTADAMISNDSGAPLIVDIRTAECAGTTVLVRQGRLELRAGGESRSLNAGESWSSLPAPPPQNLSHGKRLGLLIGIGAAVGVILAITLGTKDGSEPEAGGCAVLLSPVDGPQRCS